MIGGISSVGSSFVTIAWQSTLFLLAGLVISFILRKHSARAHRILLLSIIASILVPAMTIIVKHLGLGILEARTESIIVVEETITETPLNENTFNQFVFGPTELTFQQELTNTETPLLLPIEPEEEIVKAQSSLNTFIRENWRIILLFSWIVISFILTLRLLVTFLLGVRLLNNAEPLDCERISSALQHAKEKLAIKKDIKLYGSKIVKSPVIWCWRSKPALLVPQNAGRHHDRIDWTGVLCHELAHWKRRDHVSGLIAEIAACILPWQILLWLSKTRMINLSEHACDDWVIATGKTGTDYAESLLDMIPGGQMAFVPAVVRDKNGLAQRVQRILKDSCGNPKTGLFWAISVCMITCSIAVTIAFAQTRPAKPEPVIDPNNNDVITTTENQSLSETEDEDQVITKIYKLKYRSSQHIAQIIQPLLSTDVDLDIDDAGSLVLRGRASHLLEIEKIISDFDKPNQREVSQQIFVIAHKDPVKLVEVLKNILAQNMDTGSPTINHYESTPVSLIPWPEKNWIIARAPVGVLKLIGEILSKYDSESPSNLSYQEIVEKTNISKNTLFYFEHNFPSNIEQIIEPLLSDEGYLSTLVKEDNTGTLTIIDTPDVIHKINSVLSNFEKVTEPEIGQWIFIIRNKEPYEIIQSLRLVLKDIANKDEITLVPDPDTKSLIVHASTENMMLVRSWIAKLDQEDSYLPESWSLYYDSGVLPDGSQYWPANMAKNLASLEIFPRPIDVKDSSWKDERFEFRIYSLDGTNMDDIHVMSEDDLRDASRSIFQPGLYLLKYERGYGTPETNYRMRCESFILDMSQPGMYKLYFAPKLGYGEVSGNAGGCYAVNFEKIDSIFPMHGFAYINRQKDYLLDGLPNGTYRLSAVTQRNSDNVFVSQALVTIKDEDKVKIDIAPPSKGDCTLTGSIFGKQNTYTVGSPSNPIQRKGEWYVLLRNPGSGKVITTNAYEAKTMDSLYVIRGVNLVQETSEKANFKISGIAPGEYTVTVIESPNYQGAAITRQQSQYLIVSSGDKAELNFDLRKNKEKQIPSEQKVHVSLFNAELNQIIEALIRWSGKAVLPSNEARNLRITVSSPEPLPRSKALKLLYEAIEEQGYTITESDGIIYIRPTYKTSESKPESRIQDDSDIIGPAENEFIIDNSPNQPTENLFIVGADPRDVNDIIEIIKKAGTQEYDVIRIQNNDVIEVAARTKIALQEWDKDYKNYLSIYTLTGSKQIIVFGEKQYRDLVKNIIAEIDQPDNNLNKYETVARIQRESEKDSNDNETKSQVPQSSQNLASESIPTGSFGAGMRTRMKNGTNSTTGDKKKLIAPLAQDIVEGVRNLFRKKTDTSYDTISIKYIKANELAASITAIMGYFDINVSRNISIMPLVQSNQVIIYGKQEYRDIIKNIIAEIDKPDTKLQRKVFDLKYADSESLKKKIDEIFGDKSTPGENSQNTLSKDTVIAITYPSRNQIVVLTSKEKMKVIEKQISEWDSPIELSPILPRVYTINHTNNKEISDFLSSIFNSIDSGDKTNDNSLMENPVLQMFEDRISFIAIPEINQILADSQIIEGYLLVEAIINELDTTEFVPFDKDKAYNKILDNIDIIEESLKTGKLLPH